MTLEKGTLMINVDDYLYICKQLEFYKRAVDDIINPYLRLENKFLDDSRKALQEHIMNLKEKVDDRIDDDDIR